MNDVTLRQHMAEQALLEVQLLFHKDPQLYERRYRESIEAALFTPDENEVEGVVNPE